MTTPTPSPIPKRPSAPRRIQALDFAAFCRSVTLENPKFCRRMEREARAGNKQIIRLLEGYVHVLPPSLLEAVLAARVTVGQVRGTVEDVTQNCETG